MNCQLKCGVKRTTKSRVPYIAMKETSTNSIKKIIKNSQIWREQGMTQEGTFCPKQQRHSVVEQWSERMHSMNGRCEKMMESGRRQ